MSFSRAGQLARFVPTARLTDPIGLVAENLRSSPHGVLPVLDRITFGEGHPSERQARVLGLIDIRDLSRATRQIAAAPVPVFGADFSQIGGYTSNGFGSNGSGTNGNSNGNSTNGYAETGAENGAAPTPIEELTARDIMRADVPHIPSLFSLQNALLTFDRYDLPALPVLDEAGQYRGILSRADVIAAVGNNVRPPMVGGMATPLGVWLSNGTLNAGAPPLGLFLSGLTLAACFFVSQILLGLILWTINPVWGGAAFSGRLGAALDNTQTLNLFAFFGHKLLFLLVLRALPMAGIHAAEHQTVHALERGLPLEIEYVEKMPRAHPRCGTNLLAIASIMTIGFVHLPVGPEWIIIVLAATFFGWRSFGTLIQELFTTRPASKKQLQSGIKAARELMDKYQAQPFAQPASPFKLLNNGMMLSIAGMFTGLFGFQTLLNLLIARFLG